MTTDHKPASKLVAAILIAAILFVIGYALRHTVSCFLLSFVIAYLFDPLLVAGEGRGLKRNQGIAILYTLLTVICIFSAAFLLPVLTSSWNGLILGLPGYLQKGKQLALSWKSNQGVTAEWGWFLDYMAGVIDTLIGKLGSRVYSAASRMMFNLLNLVLAPILVFFMLFYKEQIITCLVSWLPEGYRRQLVELGEEINESVGGYIRGQLIVSAIVAVLSTVALFFLDVDYAIFNGIFAGLASILPFIGVIIATLPALFFSYIKFQSGMALLQVIGAFSVIYFVEGYVIKPLVFKKALDLNPLITIIFVMAFGECMGFWGILLAIPIAAAVKIAMGHLRKGDFSQEVL